ncbi:MAG: hypothetical protein HRT99_04250 [Mycoplasmatales bacterium]|nr:hypothetical protein [Mycoplasmatales bacterium]
MKKLSKLTIGIGIGSLATTAVAGSLIGVYAIDRSSTSVNGVLKNINSELNTLSSSTGDIDSEIEFDEFYELTMSQFDEGSAASNTTVISELISQSDNQINQIVNDITNQTVPGNTYTFIGNQMQTYFDELTNLSAQIASGYVGNHDINYYKTLIDERVETVIFDSNTESMNTKITEAKDEIAQVNNFLANELSILKQNLETEIQNVHADIVEHKDDNHSALQALNTQLMTEINAIGTLGQAERNAISSQLTSQLSLITTLQNMANETYAELVSSNANTNASIDSIIEKANQMELELSQLNAYLINFQTYVNDEMTTLKSEIDQQHLVTWELINANYTDIFTNQMNIQNNSNIISDISTNLLNLETKIQENKQNIADLDAKLLNAQAALNAKDEDLDQKIDTNMRLTTENIAIITARMNEHEAALDVIQSALDANDALIAENQALLSTVQNSIANIYYLIDQLTALANDNQAKIWNIESEVQALRSDLNDLSSDIIFSTNFINDGYDDLFTQRWYIDDIKKYSSIRFIYELDNDNFSTTTFDVALIPGDSGIRVYNHDGTIFQAHEYSMKAIVDLDNNFVQLTSPRISTLGIRGYQPAPLGAKILSVIANKLS